MTDEARKRMEENEEELLVEVRSMCSPDRKEFTKRVIAAAAGLE